MYVRSFVKYVGLLTADHFIRLATGGVALRHRWIYMRLSGNLQKDYNRCVSKFGLDSIGMGIHINSDLGTIKTVFCNHVNDGYASQLF